MFHTYHSWPDIIRMCAEHKDDFTWFRRLHELVVRLDDIGYVSAGLCGATSMYDLYLSQSRAIFGQPAWTANPRLHLMAYAPWPPSPVKCKIRYEDGSERPWETIVPFEEMVERVEWLLVKRLRWFKGTNDEEADHVAVGRQDAAGTVQRGGEL